MTEMAISTSSSIRPKHPDVYRAIARNRDGMRLADQAYSYGFWYELYAMPPVGWMIAAPFGHVFAVLLSGRAQSDFRYICERVTIQQEGRADQGKLSCPAQTMRDFLVKRQVRHMKGYCDEDGQFIWNEWVGPFRYPEFPYADTLPALHAS